MALRAILWDVGGPLNTEETHERLIDANIRAVLHAAGHNIDDDTYRAANEWAVESFAPNTYQAIIWRLTGGDVELSLSLSQEIEMRSHEGNVFELREHIPELLEMLNERGVLLGLAANQPLATISRLDTFGIGRYFHYRGVSGTHGFRKPDIRLFLTACADLDVEPTDCIMVGDRIDNDIAPARSIGMTTVLLRTGRHRHQRPRTWNESPHAEVFDVTGLRNALTAMLEGTPGS